MTKPKLSLIGRQRRNTLAAGATALAALTALALLCSPLVQAQGDRAPVRILVGFPAGGTIDPAVGRAHSCGGRLPAALRGRAGR